MNDPDPVPPATAPRTVFRPGGISPAGWAALLAAALGARLVAALGEPVIPRDAVHFLGMARTAAEEGLRPLLEREQHPLYPALVALAHRLITDWEAAGLFVSILASTLTVIPVVLLGNRVAGPPAGLLGGWVFAAARYPLQYGPSPIADGLHALFFACAAAAGAAGLGIDARADRAGPHSPGRAAHFFAAGLFAGLAYLTRPEGLVIAAALAAAAVVALATGGKKRSDLAGWGRRLAFLCLGLSLTSGPYAAWLSYQSGSLTLTRKKAILPTLVSPAKVAPAPPPRGLPESPPPAPTAGAPGKPTEEPGPAPPAGAGADQRAAPPAPTAAPPRAWRRIAGVLRFLRESAEGLGWLPAGLAVLGLVARLRSRACLLGELYLVLPVAIFALLLSGVYVSDGYTGRRHCYPLVPLLEGWVGLGLIQAGAALAARLPGGSRRAARTPAILTAVLVAVMLPKGLGLFPGDEAKSERWIREAGDALRGHVPSSDTILAVNETGRVAFYSGARVQSFHSPRAPDPVEVCRSAGDAGARWVLVELEAAPAGAPAGWTISQRLRPSPPGPPKGKSGGRGELVLYRRAG